MVLPTLISIVSCVALLNLATFGDAVGFVHATSQNYITQSGYRVRRSADAFKTTHLDSPSIRSQNGEKNSEQVFSVADFTSGFVDGLIGLDRAKSGSESETECEAQCRAVAGPHAKCADPVVESCTCKKGYVFIVKECVKATKEACDSNCRKQHGHNAVCSDIEQAGCECKNGYMREYSEALEWTTCVKKSQKACTKMCETIAGSGAACDDLEEVTCTCMEGYTLSKLPGGLVFCTKVDPKACATYCKEVSGAGKNSECGNPATLSCRCKEGYTWSDWLADSITECVDAEKKCKKECTKLGGTNAQCHDAQLGQCECKEGYVPIDQESELMSECVRVTKKLCNELCKKSFGKDSKCLDLDTLQCT